MKKRVIIHLLSSATLLALASCQTTTSHPLLTQHNSNFFTRLQTEKLTSDPSIQWLQMGPGMSGNNMHVHWHNSDPNVLFLGPNMDNAYRSTDQGLTWHTLLDPDGKSYQTHERGPYDIQSPEFSYQNPDFGFATTEDAAVIWVTQDRGATWSQLENSSKTFGNVLISDITVDPKNDNIWYAGTGKIYNVNDFGFSHQKPHGFFRKRSKFTHQARVWKTTDRGQSWHLITPDGLNKNANVAEIFIHPEHSNRIFLATTYGFYKSLDGGKSWTLKTKGFDHNIVRDMDMHFDKQTGQVTLYAIDLVKWKASGKTVANDGGGLFISRDEGESWVKTNGNLDLNVNKLASDYFFKSTYYNWGIAPWFGLTPAKAKIKYPKFPQRLMHRLARVVVDPNNPDRIYLFNDYKGNAEYTFVGGIVWRSEDGGQNWISTLRNGKAWDGVHKAYWQSRGNPTHHNITWGAQRKWKEEQSYFRKAGSAFGFNADGSMMAGQIAKVFLLSSDHGDSWKEVDEIELSPGSEAWVAGGNSNMPGHGFVQDPRIPDKMFFCTGENDYWYTVAGGDQVRPHAPAAVRNNMMAHGEFSVSSLAFHPKDKNIIYSLQFRQTNRGELLKSTDSGKHFKPIGTVFEKWQIQPYKGDQSIHQLNLTIDPQNPEYMYFNVPKKANEQNWVGDSVKYWGMHRSSDGGKSWQTINKGLPKPYDVANFRMDPNNPHVLYAALFGRKGKGGLYKSTNRGESWKKMPLPKGVFSVMDLHFAKDGKFYISTGHSTAKPGQGGLFYTQKRNPKRQDWVKIFDMPWTGAVDTAAYDPNVILLAVNGAASVDYINPGSYLSKDGGKSWIKINRGNGQSDRINDVAIDLFKPNLYYVSTRGAGVFQSDYKP